MPQLAAGGGQHGVARAEGRAALHVQGDGGRGVVQQRGIADDIDGGRGDDAGPHANGAIADGESSPGHRR